MDGTTNHLGEFTELINPDFNHITHAQSLLLATNGTESAELDLATPIKKLSFDIDELENRMTSLTTQNYQALAQKFEELDTYRDAIKSVINPSLDRIVASYDRVHTQVLKPYAEACKLHFGLKNIQATLALLRGSSFVVFMIQQIQDQETSIASLPDDENRDTVRLAKLYTQATQFYDEQVKQNDTDLMSVQIIRDYLPILESGKRRFVENCNQYVSSCFQHRTSLVLSNMGLRDRLLALYASSDEELYRLFDKYAIVKPVQVASTQLARALQAPRNFSTIMKDVELDFTDHCDRLKQITAHCNVPTDSTETVSLQSLLLEHFKVSSFRILFCTRLTAMFTTNIETTLARGGPIAKNLRVYNQGIQNTVILVFPDPIEQSLMREALAPLAAAIK